MALDEFQPYLFVSAGEQSNKYLTPVYSDGIASFQAQRAQDLTSLLIRIDPIQEGTGDPSPSNIRPISGRTGLTVTRAGKNLVNIPDVTLASEGYVFNIATFDFPAGSYVLSYNSTTPRNMGAISVTGKDDATVSPTLTTSGTRIIAAFTAPNGIKGIRVYNGAATYTDIMLEIGTSATAYEPYVGASYPITWGTEAGTIYGGTLNVTTGVLTVDKVLIDLGSITNWRYNIGNTGAFDTSGNLNPIAKNNDCICTNYKTLVTPTAGAITVGDMLVAINKKNDGTTYTGNYAVGTLIVKDSRYSDVESFKAAMNGVMLCYMLATPQTYQLTPTEIQTLAGFNQIYSDAGPVIDIKF